MHFVCSYKSNKQVSGVLSLTSFALCVSCTVVYTVPFLSENAPRSLQAELPCSCLVLLHEALDHGSVAL